jgi:D-sedoheptulose 7-phosphate isomerase
MENLLKTNIRKEIKETADTIAAMSADDDLIARINKVVSACVAALNRGNKILFAGNGGSAADCQHLAGELVSRFHYDRPGLPGVALTTDTSILTAIGNDYGYERVFARQIEASGLPGDILFAISTSGRSPNILEAIRSARQKKMVIVGMTGGNGGDLAGMCDYCLTTPSDSTPKIQEGHILMGHIICQLIEAEIFPKE